MNSNLKEKEYMVNEIYRRNSFIKDESGLNIIPEKKRLIIH
jgi:hypothetical protein